MQILGSLKMHPFSILKLIIIRIHEISIFLKYLLMLINDSYSNLIFIVQDYLTIVIYLIGFSKAWF